MARWFSRYLAVAADAIFPLIADFVAGGTGWDLYDDISVHIKVYRCTGGATTFYVEVDHTTAAVVIIKLATGWDAVNHVYSGYKTLAQWMTIVDGAYAINGDEETFYIQSLIVANIHAIYVGYADPLDVTDTKAICLSGNLSSGGASGMFYTGNTTQMWLYGVAGGNGGIIKTAPDAQFQYSFNLTLGVMYLTNVRLANVDESSRYRANAKFCYSCSQTLPTGFAAGDGIQIGEKIHRLRAYSTAPYCLWVLWE